MWSVAADISMQTKHTALGVTNTQTTTPTTARKKAAENVEHVEGKGDTVKGKQIWECDRCKVKVELFIPPVAPPTHRCRKATNKTIQLTERGKTNE